jgi:hypothetical protein
MIAPHSRIFAVMEFPKLICLEFEGSGQAAGRNAYPTPRTV